MRVHLQTCECICVRKRVHTTSRRARPREDDNEQTTRSEDTNYIHKRTIRTTYKSNYKSHLLVSESFQEVYLRIGFTSEVALELAFLNRSDRDHN